MFRDRERVHALEMAYRGLAAALAGPRPLVGLARAPVLGLGNHEVVATQQRKLRLNPRNTP